MDEWRQIEEELGDSQTVLRLRARAAELAADLEPGTRALLALVDARRPVAEIVRESGLEPYDGLLRINELISVGAVERWDPPLTAGSSSEQAQTEAGSAPRIELDNFQRRKPRARQDDLVIKAREAIRGEENTPEPLSSEQTLLRAAEAMLSG